MQMAKMQHSQNETNESFKFSKAPLFALRNLCVAGGMNTGRGKCKERGDLSSFVRGNRENVRRENGGKTESGSLGSQGLGIGERVMAMELWGWRNKDLELGVLDRG